MMTLSLMKRFFDTVQPDGRSPIADRIVAQWFPIGAKARVCRASANFVFKVRADDHDFFLRFNHESEREAPFLEAECRFLAHLAGRRVHVNLPVPSAAGQFVESVRTEMGLFHAMLFGAVLGEQRSIEDMDSAGFEAWGRLAGDIHVASQGYEEGGRPSWVDLLAHARGWLPSVEVAARAELDRVEQAVRSRSFSATNHGLIHYDLELDNIVWGERPGVVDFDDSAYCPFAADIAFALRDLWDDRPDRINLADERLHCFVHGYRGVHALEESELRSLPLYLRLHNLVMFARLVRALSEPTPDAPEWTQKLRAKLDGSMQWRREEFERAKHVL